MASWPGEFSCHFSLLSSLAGENLTLKLKNWPFHVLRYFLALLRILPSTAMVRLHRLLPNGLFSPTSTSKTQHVSLELPDDVELLLSPSHIISIGSVSKPYFAVMFPEKAQFASYTRRWKARCTFLRGWIELWNSPAGIPEIVTMQEPVPFPDC